MAGVTFFFWGDSRGYTGAAISLSVILRDLAWRPYCWAIFGASVATDRAIPSWLDTFLARSLSSPSFVRVADGDDILSLEPYLAGRQFGGLAGQTAPGSFRPFVKG